jgi:hypothetical protein
MFDSILWSFLYVNFKFEIPWRDALISWGSRRSGTPVSSRDE